MKRLFVVLSLTLWPTALRAVTDNSALTCDSATATYFPRGDHWPIEPPIGTHPVVFLQQKDGAPGAAAAQSLIAVSSAFDTWMQVRCPPPSGTASPNVSIIEGAQYATRDRGDTFICPGGGVCGTACEEEVCWLETAKNIIYFVISNWSDIADPATVGLTTNLYIPDTGFLITSDMELNAVNYQWRANGTGCSSGSATCFDVETVVLHEAGHFLGLNHVMCQDAVMFPQGSGTASNHVLTSHEETAICTIYSPRPTSGVANRYTGEQCTADSQCPTSPAHYCIKPMGMTAADYWGWCAKQCTSTSSCGTGFICVEQEGGPRKFCRPGPNGTGGAIATDPNGTGAALDVCKPCTDGNQCSSGVCINQGGTTDGICTQTCVTSVSSTTDTGDTCPSGLTCRVTDQNSYVCWPDDPAACAAQHTLGKLNDMCYLENTSGTGSDWYKACGADLVCFVFKPRCGGQMGACVSYCNATDKPCPSESGYTCCHGVDELGNCIGPAANRPHGGCFDIRRPGESCVTAEQSICGENSSCFHFGNESLAKCYSMCSTNESECDQSLETCVTYSDGCSNSFSLCCDAEIWDPQGQECVPTDAIQFYDVGVRCDDSSQCDSGLCQGYQGDKACSRPCNPVTGVGCPGDVDVNADGMTDGGFRCLLISGEGRCWPTYGPVEPPVRPDTTTEDGGGCCNATTLKSGDLFLAALVWMPLVANWLRRRRR